MKHFLKYWSNRIFSNVHHKYRLVVMDEMFKEKLSFRLSRMNVFVVVGMTGILLITGTSMLLAFTSLREFIPGYTKDKIVQLAYQNQNKVDSLEYIINAQEQLLFAMKTAISGEIPIEKVEDVIDSTPRNYENIAYERSAEDQQLREQVEKGEKFNLTRSYSAPTKGKSPETSAETAQAKTVFHTQSASNVLFYVPLEGTIVIDFDESEKHFGVDITGKKNDVIKAIQNGTVVSSEWTSDGGYVIIIQHENNMRSLYKHNSAVLKNTGDNVKAGEPVAFIGNSGEGYKGPILHFELWYNGSPVNPRNYVVF